MFGSSEIVRVRVGHGISSLYRLGFFDAHLGIDVYDGQSKPTQKHFDPPNLFLAKDGYLC